MALICACDLSNIKEINKNRDIFISNVSLAAYGRHTGQAFEADIITFQTDNNLNCGPVHHAKVLYSRDDPHSSTKVMFLRFCDPSCHEQVINKLNGVEWPIGSGKYLNFEFNRNFTQQHHLLARERYVNRDAATQTDHPETSNTSTLTSGAFGSTSTLSDFCFWTSEDIMDSFMDSKYSIFCNDDDASTAISAKIGAKKSTVKNNGSVNKMMARLLLNQKRIK
ncbi:hypothetical protein BpHYR1_033446 [Brachionus plicatilis]|uniref:Uncharacterized protein n=1 Tax=Brachionus plicatilis TaxID=10195 RepID=A0A3M7PF85_BRAPC|nr:hypothetical protein BpHYR1_033446 [Brachionus plicatilis]